MAKGDVSLRTLVHLSDLHIGRDEATDEAARRLARMLAAARVDQVLLTGDVTHRGMATELARYERIFAPLLEDGAPRRRPRQPRPHGRRRRARPDAGRARGHHLGPRAPRGPGRLDGAAQPLPHRRARRPLRPGRGRRADRAGGDAAGRAPGGDAAPPRASTPGGGPGREAGHAGGAALRGRASPRGGPPGPDPGALQARAPRPPARPRRVPRRPARARCPCASSTPGARRSSAGRGSSRTSAGEIAWEGWLAAESVAARSWSPVVRARPLGEAVAAA